MKLLVLGGTKFLGRATVDSALARGHEVTTFTRGQTNPELFPDVEKLHGDRDGNLDALRNRSWDAVIDVAGYLPRVVRQTVELVEAPYYLFVSTISVYADLSRPIDEDSPVRRDVDSEEIMEYYGELKAMCERVVQERPGAIVRPGLIVGPHDPTGRFTYWPHRMSRGGDVLAPGPPDEPVTLIDVRDLGEWLVRLCASQTQGVFNAIERTTWRALLEACVREVRPDARLVWVPSDWLSEQGVDEWMELPVWTGPQSSEHAGLHRVANDRAVAAGLTFRPLEETVRATLAEAATTDDAGLKPQREAGLLAEWASLASGG